MITEDLSKKVTKLGRSDPKKCFHIAQRQVSSSLAVENLLNANRLNIETMLMKLLESFIVKVRHVKENWRSKEEKVQ